MDRKKKIYFIYSRYGEKNNILSFDTKGKIKEVKEIEKKYVMIIFKFYILLKCSQMKMKVK